MEKLCARREITDARRKKEEMGGGKWRKRVVRKRRNELERAWLGGGDGGEGSVLLRASRPWIRLYRRARRANCTSAGQVRRSCFRSSCNARRFSRERSTIDVTNLPYWAGMYFLIGNGALQLLFVYYFMWNCHRAIWANSRNSKNRHVVRHIFRYKTLHIKFSSKNQFRLSKGMWNEDFKNPLLWWCFINIGVYYSTPPLFQHRLRSLHPLCENARKKFDVSSRFEKKEKKKKKEEPAHRFPWNEYLERCDEVNHPVCVGFGGERSR